MTLENAYMVFVGLFTLYCLVVTIICSYKEEWPKATYHLVMLIWLIQIKK